MPAFRSHFAANDFSLSDLWKSWLWNCLCVCTGSAWTVTAFTHDLLVFLHDSCCIVACEKCNLAQSPSIDCRETVLTLWPKGGVLDNLWRLHSNNYITCQVGATLFCPGALRIMRHPDLETFYWRGFVGGQCRCLCYNHWQLLLWKMVSSIPL